jgi:hypothetical protein
MVSKKSLKKYYGKHELIIYLQINGRGYLKSYDVDIIQDYIVANQTNLNYFDNFDNFDWCDKFIYSDEGRRVREQFYLLERVNERFLREYHSHFFGMKIIHMTSLL